MKVGEGLAMPHYQEREALVVAFLCDLVEQGRRLSTEGQRSLCCSLASFLPSLQPSSQLLLLAPLLGDAGLLPSAAIHSSSPGFQRATVGLVQGLLASKSVAVLTEVPTDFFLDLLFILQVWRLVVGRAEEAVVRLQGEEKGQELLLLIQQGEKRGLSQAVARRQLAWVLACLAKLATTSGSVLSM